MKTTIFEDDEFTIEEVRQAASQIDLNVTEDESGIMIHPGNEPENAVVSFGAKPADARWEAMNWLCKKGVTP